MDKRTIYCKGPDLVQSVQEKFRTNESTPNLRLGFRIDRSSEISVGLGLMDQTQEANADSLIQPSPDLMGRVVGNNTY